MIALGLILLILGLLFGMGILLTIGLVLILVGVVLNFAPAGGGRRWW